jgi:mono/diheme cytochrome c family protein
MNLIMRTIPSGSPTPTDERTLEDELVKGKYLMTIAACSECHTPQDKGKPIEGKFMAGGFEFQFPNGAVVRSVNITPDKETGIGNWTEDAFVQRFKTYEAPEATAAQVDPDAFNTVMPWAMYAGMTEEDLRALYKYMRTLEPIRNKVERYTPAGAVAKK